jgi:hypothetical protein
MVHERIAFEQDRTVVGSVLYERVVIWWDRLRQLITGVPKRVPSPGLQPVVNRAYSILPSASRSTEPRRGCDDSPG